MDSHDLEQEFASRKAEIERALAYTGGTHDLDDIWAGIESGKFQLWCGPHSVMITEVESYPKFRCLHFFLAAGRMPELEAMYPSVMEWGKDQMGCTVASLAGRPGWARSFLTRENGWQTSHLVMMKEM